MFVRMKAMKKMSSKRYRVTLDVLDPERDHWDYGDCQFQVDLPPKDPPAGVEAKLLWDIGQAVEGFVDRVFAAGIVCPFRAEAPADAEERSE